MDPRLILVFLVLQIRPFSEFAFSENISNEQQDVWRHYMSITSVSDAQFKLNNEHGDHLNHSSDRDSSEATSNSTAELSCDFGGEHLLVAVSPQPPLVNCFQNLYGYWMCNGSNIEVIRVLEREFNFEADWLVLTNSHLDRSLTTSRRDHHHLLSGSGKTWAEKDVSDLKDVNFTGVLALVVSGRASLSANGFMPTPERERSKILSEPFDSFKLHFLLSKSVRDHDHIFIKPFQTDAWLAILTSALLIVPIFYLINFTSSHYTLCVDKKLSRLSFWDCIYHLVSKSLGIKSGCLRGRIRSTSLSASSTSLSDEALYKLAVSTQVLVLQPRSDVEEKRRKQLRYQMKLWAAERRQARRIDKWSRKSGFFNIAYIIWYVAGSLTTQGGETEDLPHATSTRILIAFWWLYLIVITSIHSGILTAILTFPRQSDFIQTLDDFMALNVDEKGYMKVAVDKHSELANLFSNPDNLHKSPLRQLLMPSGRSLTVADEAEEAKKGQLIVEVDFQRHRQRVLDDVLRGQSAYIEEKAFIDQIITQEYFDHKTPRCMFKSSRFPVGTIPMSLALSSKLAPTCLQSINNLLRRIMRTGLSQKWRRSYEVQGNDCLNTVIINAGDVDKIQYRHIKLAAWLLSAGLSIGLVFLFIEVVWLFTADADLEDDEDLSTGASSSSSSGSSDEQVSSFDNSSDELRFGHHIARLAQHPFNGRHLSSRLSLRLRRSVGRKVGCTSALPVNLLTVDTFQMADVGSVAGNACRKGTTNRQPQQLARRGERRAKRLRRALAMVRRLQEGKLYSDFFLKVSERVQSRVRRTSLAPTTQVGQSIAAAAVAAPTAASTSSFNRTSAVRQRRAALMAGKRRSNKPERSLEGPIRRRRPTGQPPSTLNRRRPGEDASTVLAY